MMISSQQLPLLKYDQNGLIPAIIQDIKSGTVLMLAYMNRESLEKTLAEGRTCFYSRSRQQLWAKGETSGHIQKVMGIYYDCDSDTLLVQVEQTGAACHEGSFSCFTRTLIEGGQNTPTHWAVLSRLEELVKKRQETLPQDSYTSYLFTKGLDKILKKVGEEATEVVIAAKGGDKGEVIYETADLIYHLLVLLRNEGVELSEILLELERRFKPDK